MAHLMLNDFAVCEKSYLIFLLVNNVYSNVDVEQEADDQAGARGYQTNNRHSTYK